MSKQGGLGANLYVASTNVSGDINSVSSISGSIATIDVTGIDKSAHERIGGKRDGNINFVSYWNPASTASAHSTFSGLPRTDVNVTYASGTTLGVPAASVVAKQIDYPGNRNDDGSYTFNIACQANGYGLEWGRMLTAGTRTDTTATNGTSVDGSASSSFGGTLFLHVFAVTGTSVTVKLQDSADNSSFSDVTGGAFTAATGATFQRLALGSTATVRRYVRIVTTGTFTNAQFAVNFCRHTTATVF